MHERGDDSRLVNLIPIGLTNKHDDDNENVMSTTGNKN